MIARSMLTRYNLPAIVQLFNDDHVSAQQTEHGRGRNWWETVCGTSTQRFKVYGTVSCRHILELGILHTKERYESVWPQTNHVGNFACNIDLSGARTPASSRSLRASHDFAEYLHVVVNDPFAQEVCYICGKVNTLHAAGGV